MLSISLDTLQAFVNMQDAYRQTVINSGLNLPAEPISWQLIGNSPDINGKITEVYPVVEVGDDGQTCKVVGLVVLKRSSAALHLWQNALRKPLQTHGVSQDAEPLQPPL